MHLLQPTSDAQLLYCCDLYMSQNVNDFLRVEADTCRQSIQMHRAMGNYIKIIHHDGEIVGFIMASLVATKHSREKTLLQEYYCTNLKGFAAAKAVKLAHRDMVAYAKLKKIRSVTSCGSHMDPEHVFTRILERDGWKRQGHVAIMRLAFDVAQAPEAQSRSRSRSVASLAR